MNLILVSQVITIFIIPLFVKNLGTELYGIWVLSFVILGYLGFFEMGFGEGITKYISEAYVKKDKEKLNSVINTGVFLYFCVGLIICLICFFLKSTILSIFKIQPGNIHQAQSLLVIAGLYAVIQWPMRIINVTMRGLLKFKVLKIFEAIQLVMTNIILLVCVYNNLEIEVLFIIRNISHFLFWIPIFMSMRRFIPDFSFKKEYLSFNIVREISPFSFGVFISRVISAIGLRLDNFIIGVFLSMGAITAYTIASKLFYAAQMQIAMLSGVIWPTIFTANALGNRRLIEKMLKKGTKYMAIIVSPIGYLGIIISQPFIQLWMGPEYVKYALWAQIFMLIYLICPGLGLASNIAMASGKCRQFNTVTGIGVTVNLILSVLFVRVYGIGGPILGTVIANLLIGPLAFPYFCKLIGIEWKRALLTIYRVVAFNLPSFFLFYWLIHKITVNSWPLIIFVSIFILTCFYVPLYYLFFDVEEKEDIKKILMFGTRKLIALKQDNI